MSTIESFRQLAAGERRGSGLLHTVRLEAFGVEAYGIEAVIESFRRGNDAIADTALAVAAPGHIAIFDEDKVIFADLHGDLIARRRPYRRPRLSGCGKPAHR